MTLVELDGGRVTSREEVKLSLEEEDDLVAALHEFDVDLLVCGGISRDLADDLEADGVDVVRNVAGEVDEVLEALAREELRPGHGLQGRSRIPSAAPPAPLPSVDCLDCLDRACAHDGACPVEVGLGGAPWLRGDEARIYEAGRDVSAQSDPKLCRIAELVHFGVEAGYRRIGVAFCSELFQEVETLVCVLRRFFEVVPVCCRISTGEPAEGGEVADCNPVAQARLLEAAGTELNVIAGLCLGCDTLFTGRSHAPVTTLFVKDRLLAHNPVGAIYTRYHLEHLELR